MAVPSSGELKLRADINLEVNGNATDDNVSLGTLSNEAGFTEPDNMSEFYGYTSCTAPSVTTNAIDNVSYTSMRANGNVTADNGCTITERGFYFGTSSNMTSNTKYVVSGTTGSFNRNFTGLTSGNVRYYAWAYATNSAGTTYGSSVYANTLTPATYSLIQTYTNTNRWRSPQSFAYSWGAGDAAAQWNANAQMQYNHASYGWTTANSYTNNKNSGSRPTTDYTRYLNDYRYKRTDTTQITSHRTRMNGYIYNLGWTANTLFMDCDGGDAQVPSQCTSGASTNQSYQVGYSYCNLGCGLQWEWNCQCQGAGTGPSSINWTGDSGISCISNGTLGQQVSVTLTNTNNTC